MFGRWFCRIVVLSSKFLPFCDCEVSEEFSNEVFGSSKFVVVMLLFVVESNLNFSVLKRGSSVLLLLKFVVLLLKFVVLFCLQCLCEEEEVAGAQKVVEKVVVVAPAGVPSATADSLRNWKSIWLLLQSGFACGDLLCLSTSDFRVQ